MTTDIAARASPLTSLGELIVEAGRERDRLEQHRRESLAARDRQKAEATASWTDLKQSVATMVAKIDRMLKDGGFRGLAIVPTDQKHTDIDRIVIEFEHATRDHSKILVSVSEAGEFTCGVGPTYEGGEKMRIPMAELTREHIEEGLANAVAQCIRRKRA